MKNRNPVFKKLKNDTIYLFIVALVWAVRAFPRSCSLLLARWLARGAHFLFSGERKKTEAHLALAFGERLPFRERRALSRKVFLNIAQNLVDSVLMRSLLRGNAESIISIAGFEIAKQAQEKGKGVIFLTAHTGCFEMLSARFAQLGFPVFVLGAKIYDPRINALIVQNRQVFNIEYIERGQDLRLLLRSLHAGSCFGVLCDLDTRVESRFIDFFGAPAKTPVGPFKLGIKFDIPLIPVFVRRTPEGRQEAIVLAALHAEGISLEDKTVSAMRQYNRLLQSFIEQDPSQWIWMHERWKSKS
jgi:Kdo2-lipid IVA lauroyltransferase/acyltransferase